MNRKQRARTDLLIECLQEIAELRTATENTVHKVFDERLYTIRPVQAGDDSGNQFLARRLSGNKDTLCDSSEECCLITHARL